MQGAEGLVSLISIPNQLYKGMTKAVSSVLFLKPNVLDAATLKVQVENRRLSLDADDADLNGDYIRTYLTLEEEDTCVFNNHRVTAEQLCLAMQWVTTGQDMYVTQLKESWQWF